MSPLASPAIHPAVMREVRKPGLLSRSTHRTSSRLGDTTGCSLPADRSPTSLGVHEGSFEAMALFAELQTVFLAQTVDFPP